MVRVVLISFIRGATFCVHLLPTSPHATAFLNGNASNIALVLNDNETLIMFGIVTRTGKTRLYSLFVLAGSRFIHCIAYDKIPVFRV